MALIEQHTKFSNPVSFTFKKKKNYFIIFFFGDNRLMTFVIDNHNEMSKRPIIDYNQSSVHHLLYFK